MYKSHHGDEKNKVSNKSDTYINLLMMCLKKENPTSLSANFFQFSRHPLQIIFEEKESSHIAAKNIYVYLCCKI